MFLKSQLEERLSELVTVDISAEVVKVAKEYFGFQEDGRLKSVV
jgi:spermidine synthase